MAVPTELQSHCGKKKMENDGWKGKESYREDEGEKKKEIWKYKRGERGRRETDQREWTEVSAFTVQTPLEPAITVYISWRFFPYCVSKIKLRVLTAH